MKRAAILAVSISLLASSSLAFGAARRMPPGSYLRKPVSSVNELAAQIGKDRVVQKEFAKHFGIRPGELESYLKDNVVIRRVSANTPKYVYVVRRNGTMVAERKVLPKGTAVFALKDTGEPLLVAVCGNPVMKRLPPREKVKAEAPQTYQLLSPTEAALPPVVAGVTAAPEAMTPLPPATLGAPPPIPPPVTAPPVVAAGSKGSFLPLVAGAFVHHGHNGPPPTPPPPPIPEPGGAAAVAATAIFPAAGWAIRRLRYRRDAV
jgi:hypothetical protein